MNNPNKLLLTTRGKQLRTAVAATALALSAGFLHNGSTTPSGEETPVKLGYYFVHEGDQDPTHIARHLIVPEDDKGNELDSDLSAEQKNERINKLAGLMMDGAGKDGIIRAGDVVPIDANLIDPSHMDELTFPDTAK